MKMIKSIEDAKSFLKNTPNNQGLYFEVCLKKTSGRLVIRRIGDIFYINYYQKMCQISLDDASKKLYENRKYYNEKIV